VKIQAVQVPPPGGTSEILKHGVVMLKVSGPLDSSNEIMKRAREMVVRSGYEAMIQSFDRSLESAKFITEK
jgi:hypothetical protein